MTGKKTCRLAQILFREILNLRKFPVCQRTFFFGAENGETALYFELNYARVVQLHSSVRQALKYKALLFYV